MTEVTALPAAGPLTGDEILPVLQSGAAVKTTVADMGGKGTLQISFSQVAIPATAPTIAVNPAAGNLNGAYYYAATYVTADGETDRGPLTGSISPANQQVDLTAIPVSPDISVVARKIYRTPAGAADPVLLQLVATINDNTTTTYTDNIADGVLGADVPYINTTGGQIFVDGFRVYASGAQSLANGIGSLLSNTGYSNTANGNGIMPAVRRGFRNAGTALYSLFNLRDGKRNTFDGVHSGGGTIDGSDGSGLGYAVLLNNEGNNNAVVGSYGFSVGTNLSGVVGLGAFVGFWTTESDVFYVDNQQRSDEATQKITSLLYGGFNYYASLQFLRVNGLLDLTTVGAIKFPAVQVASTDANTLDDYEEGTGTPTNPNVTLSVNTGWTYCKVGRQIIASCDVTWPTTADTNTAVIAGFPVTLMANLYQFGQVVTNYGSPVTCQAYGGTSVTILNALTGAVLTNADLSGKRVQVSLSFLANS